MAAAAISRRVQPLLLAGLVFLLAWQVAALGGGLALEVAGALAGWDPTVALGRPGVLVGAGGYAYLVARLLAQRRQR